MRTPIQTNGLMPMFARLPVPMTARTVTRTRPIDPLSALLAPISDGADIVIGGLQGLTGGFKVDIEDAGDEYILRADFPGAKKEDIEIDMEDDVMTISYKASGESEQGDGTQWIARERSSVSMTRSFPLPDADDEKTTATLEDGVMEVHVPKREKHQESTKIEIS